MKNKTLFYIELPPPIHGMTYLNKILHEEFLEVANCSFCITNFSDSLKSIASRSFLKVFRNILIILKCWKSFGINNPNQVYSILSATKFGIMRDFMILLLPILCRKNKILHLHGFTYFDIYQKSSLYRFMFKLILKKSTFIVLCDFHKQVAKEVMGINATVIRNTLIDKSHSNKDESYDMNVMKLLYIGNISRSKGVFKLIETVSKLNQVKLTIAGSIRGDGEQAVFEKLINENKDKVDYIGFADENRKKVLLESHDVFCMTSCLSEGSPISILEALSFGLPVIGTCKGCIPEMIKDCGEVLDVDYEINTFEEKLNKIKDNYKNLSEISVKNFSENYSREHFKASFTNLLNGL